LGTATRSARVAGLAALVVAAWPLVAPGLDFTYFLEYRLQYDDNVNRTPDNEVDTWANVGIVGFRMDQGSRELEVRGGASAEYRVYRSDEVTDESVYNADLLGVWHISPRYLKWTVEDYLSHVTVNPLLSESPANRQQENVFSTGPDLYMRPSAVDTLRLGARYGTQSFSEEGVDSTRKTGTASWEHRVSPLTTPSLHYINEQVAYEEGAIDPDFDREDFYLQITTEQGRNLLSADYGVTRIDRVGFPLLKENRWHASWTRDLGAESYFRLSFGDELQDAGRLALASGADQAATGVPSGGLDVIVGDVFEERDARAIYFRRRASGADRLHLFHVEREYDQAVANDEISDGASLDIEQTFAEGWTGAFRTGYTLTEFQIDGREDTDWTVSASLGRRLSLTLTTSFVLEHNTRTSTNPAVEFEENVFTFTLRYQSLTAVRR
jgi:hypothetical protein